MTETPPAAAHLDPAYRRALLVCAALNLAMFFGEGAAGLWIGSAALLADAVDFIEDAAVLGLAVAAIGWSVRARANAGLAQSAAMALVGFGAVAQIVRRLAEGGAPAAEPLGGVALLALAVNLYCAARLVRFRRGDSSMRAIWLSAKNDAVLNLLTVAAAMAIAATGSGWPDILAGALIAAINLYAAWEVAAAALRERGGSGEV